MGDQVEGMEALRYPVGRYRPPGAPLTDEERTARIAEIEALPGELRSAVEGLDEQGLDTPYRPGGWTVRQVVHHVADSHVNGYVRLKWALTEDAPVIKTYEEAAWAETPDARSLPPEVSLALLDTLHRRWVAALRSLPDEAFSRMLRPPDGRPLRLDALLELYAWHGRHHTAHVTRLREREGL